MHCTGKGYRTRVGAGENIIARTQSFNPHRHKKSIHHVFLSYVVQASKQTKTTTMLICQIYLLDCTKAYIRNIPYKGQAEV